MITETLKRLRHELTVNSDEKTRTGSKRFFKEDIQVYGVKSAVGKRITTHVWQEIKSWSKEDIFDLVEKMYQSGMCEEQWMAADIIYRSKHHYTQSDINQFETWIEKHISNWASCDTFCNHALGEMMVQFPEETARLKRWTKSENRWMRRAAAVSLIVPAKRGMFLPEVFELATLLLLDNDDMVQKGYGWLLKEASRMHQQEVFEFVVAHKAIMPRTALRYAIEKMPQDLRKHAMAKA
jgi:3-methyladenine DNA glycosylase AlkD